jgi:hypothetical protein
MNIRRAIVAALVLLTLGRLPAWAQVAGNEVVCTGVLRTITVNPPNRISWGGRDVVHEGNIRDEASGRQCLIDQDGLGAPQSWSCNSGDRCSVVGILAARYRPLIVAIRNGKRVDWPGYYIVLHVISVEKLE